MSHCFNLKISNSIWLWASTLQAVRFWIPGIILGPAWKMRLWSIIITVFTIAAFSFGPPLYWNTYLVWFFRFSQLLPPSSHLADDPPESCCPTISGLDDILSGRMWDVISRVPPRGWLVVKYRSLGELPPYEINLDQWEMGDRREPKSITCLLWLLWMIPLCKPHWKRPSWQMNMLA